MESHQKLMLAGKGPLLTSGHWSDSLTNQFLGHYIAEMSWLSFQDFIILFAVQILGTAPTCRKQQDSKTSRGCAWGLSKWQPGL